VFVIDFEDLPVTTEGDGMTELSVLVPEAFGDEPVLFMRDTFAFEVVDPTQNGSAPGFGSRSLSPFRFPNVERFLAFFPSPVARVSVELGDFEPDADELDLLALNTRQSSFVDTDEATLPASNGQFTSAMLTVTGEITNVAFGGGVRPGFGRATAIGVRR
jgi:hypothetical protein